MIEARELRLGNLFTSKNPIIGSWIEKQRFDKNIYRVRRCTFECPPEDSQWLNFCGIQLTEEWLKMFGLEPTYSPHHKQWIEVYREEPLFYMQAPKGFEEGFFIDLYLDHDIYDRTKYAIKYVHQLQNLYFALTGEELTID